ncbi:hypothetical protein DVH24_020714 [Malus domestica]|uniref:Uncharacterized protein n=1 Tax=Malus domestica TaxID=3750 RepID=A0A498JE92_MALDO|nr:hypothetical protein DVH24_020714 [Malus domestica]
MITGIGCWDLRTGAEQLRYKLCASPPHGLICVGERFLASSQLCKPSASSGSVRYWSWSKLQVDVKSFPEEPINPLSANSEGTSVNTGILLKKWHPHESTTEDMVDAKPLLCQHLRITHVRLEDGVVRVWEFKHAKGYLNSI